MGQEQIPRPAGLACGPPQRTGALKQVEAVEMHAQFGCGSVQAGRKCIPVPAADECPTPARDEARDGVILRHCTEEIRLFLASEQTVAWLKGRGRLIGSNPNLRHGLFPP
jgi:hypothetical protein